MIKSVLIYTVVFFSLFFLGLNLHENYLVKKGVILPFSLKKVYLFHMVFSLLICVNFKLFSIVDKIYRQLGFIYLATILLKIILFGVIFYKSIFSGIDLDTVSRISLFIPAVIFLLTEAIFVVKILNQKQ